MRRAVPALVLTGALLTGCAYYNSMYQAVHIAHRAARAEREGRSFDAQGMWGQVAVEAETTIVRHPQSKWVVPARFLQGKAYQRLGACDRAVGPLEFFQSQSADSQAVFEARGLLAGCYVMLGDPAAAAVVYRQLVGSPDPAMRRRAHYAIGMAELDQGNAVAALADLEASQDPRAAVARATALARLGRSAEAGRIADSLIVARDSTVPWDTLFDAIGAADPALASVLVDRRAAVPGTPAELGARLIELDGLRRVARDTTAGLARLAEVGAKAPGGDAARGAAVALSTILAARATGPGDLDSAAAPLERFGRPSPAAALIVAPELDNIRWLRGQIDSLAPAEPTGDMRTFLVAEFARDSVGARRLAVRLFERVAVEASTSPYAAKALLAAAVLDSVAADSLRQVVLSRYADSPYLIALNGGAPPAFAALEDSLLTYAQAHPRARRPAPRRRGADQL